MKKEDRRSLANVVKQITPSPEEENAMAALFKDVASKIKIPKTQVILGGSGAKGTWLKDDCDMDIYVKFQHAAYKDRSDQLSELLHKALKKKLKGITRVHGSRDYFHLKKEGYTIIALEQNKTSASLFDFSPAPNEKLAVVMGNEVRGINAQSLKHTDHILHIPMQGKKESLNVGVAADIALFTLLK